MITRKRLKQIFHYCPETGIFTRLIVVGTRGKVGDSVGCDSGRGYRCIRIDSKTYSSHRLAYLYMTGKFPDDEIDHISGDRTDNRWCNLRAVTRNENLKNQKTPSNNKSGVIGVHWSASGSKWYAQITANGIQKHLGCFDDLSVAKEARKKAEIDHGFHQNHGRAK